jgi:predicted Rossmann fold nucleotide-binding protein DprA/Smf involved in DNA uptake
MGNINGAMSNKKIYAGTGSRKTPPETLVIIKKLAGLLERKGWLLRSGGADGADTAFEQGVMDARHRAIFLPGDWFNERKTWPGGFYDSTKLPGWEKAPQLPPHRS